MALLGTLAAVGCGTASPGLGSSSRPAVPRTDVPGAAFLTVSEIETGGAERVVHLTGDEVASAGEAGPNQTCGQGAVRGYSAWVSKEFLSQGRQPLGYERIVTYRTTSAAGAAVAANVSATATCARRYAGDPAHERLHVTHLPSTGLGPLGAAFEITYTVATPGEPGEPAVEYVAELAVANVYAEVQLSGEQVKGLDPGAPALLSTADTGRRLLLAVYGSG